jgi:hypothetical protein
VTYLITFICILIALTLFVGAFYLAKQHISIQYRVNVLEDSYKEATDYIAQQEETILQLKSELDFIHREEETRTTRNEPRRSWNPGDLMNTGSRQ